MSSDNKKTTGNQGWQEFIANKEKMLSAYDSATTYTKNKPIHVDQGKVAEAEFRQWLSRFLPQKYGVTSGYIICQGFNDEEKLRHFDVIVYDQLNSPILWVENNPDSSSQGNIRAIPAEYIHGVFEIKSSLNEDSAKQAISKLDELEPLLKGSENNQEYKKFLPQNIALGIVFFELKNQHATNLEILKILAPKNFYRGFLNTLVLRGEELEKINAGRILTLDGKLEPSKSLGDSLFKHPFPSISFLGEGDVVKSRMLYWAPSMFSMYAFDILALMEGTYSPNRVSSLHALAYEKENAE